MSNWKGAYGWTNYTIDDIDYVRVRLYSFENLESGKTLRVIVNAVDGLHFADEINYISSVNIGNISVPTDEMIQSIKDDNHEIAGALNVLSVDKSGWYVMKITLSEELFELLRGTNAENLKVYSLADSESQPRAALVSGFLNTCVILSLTGEKIDIIGVREFLCGRIS